MDLDRSCKCVKVCGVCMPCPNDMTQEDFLCDECRESCGCHNMMGMNEPLPRPGPSLADYYTGEHWSREILNVAEEQGFLPYDPIKNVQEVLDGLRRASLDLAEGRLEVPPDQPTPEG